jgi:hypothetical protein
VHLNAGGIVVEVDLQEDGAKIKQNTLLKAVKRTQCPENFYAILSAPAYDQQPPRAVSSVACVP